MKKLLCLTLCLAFIMGVMTGCAVKPSGGPGATGESSPEVSKEVTKEPTEETKEDTATISPNKDLVDKEENKEDKKEEKEPEKVEETPEFYDFMTLDPEPEWTINSRQDFSEISSKLYKKVLDYKKTGKMTFKKKEIYYKTIYDETYLSGGYISITFKHNKDNFFSNKTRKKLADLDLKFGEPAKTSSTLLIISENNIPEKKGSERVEQIKEGIKIALQDHNVAYVVVNIESVLD